MEIEEWLLCVVNCLLGDKQCNVCFDCGGLVRILSVHKFEFRVSAPQN